MKTFQEFKSDFIKLCEKNNSCEYEFKQVLKSKNKSMLLKVIKDNFSWCYENSIMSKESILALWEIQELKEIHIYFENNQEIVIREDSVIILWGSSQNTIKAWGSSQNIIEKIDSNSVLIDLTEKKIHFVNNNYKVILH